ncbi:MAG: GvpL/GvpF family gas vesicle protein [Gemmatimonadota bacterium]
MRQPGEQDPERVGGRGADGLYLYGVIRARSWRSGAEPGLTRVRYRDLEALVRPVPYQLPVLEDARVREHQRLVESSMRRCTILPAPYGLVFRGRRAVIRFLEDQYIVLDEGLAFLDGHWELRLHIGGDPDDGGLRELATELYSELRGFARAAIPLPGGTGRVLSAAFLVERGGWIEFIERSDDMGLEHPRLTFDVTGPWPPYDFVRVQP